MVQHFAWSRSRDSFPEAEPEPEPSQISAAAAGAGAGPFGPEPDSEPETPRHFTQNRSLSWSRDSFPKQETVPSQLYTAPHPWLPKVTDLG